jgi:hypothetical protein
MPVHFSFTLFVVLATALFAQSDRGTITGTITDPAAAVVPNASVTAVNAENGSQSQTVTTATGHYAGLFAGGRV